jgi:hypothetical protein
MVPPEKPGEGEENDVLSNLPRSRRQRPSARREQARAERDTNGSAPRKAGAAASGSGDGAAKSPSAKPEREPAPTAAAAGEPERARRRVPASGYATVHEPGSYGNADPDELLKSFVRGILRRLPG